MAASCVELMRQTQIFTDEQLLRFVEMHQTFDHQVAASNLIDSDGNVSDAIWDAGLIFTVNEHNPLRITTRSNTITIVAKNASFFLDAPVEYNKDDEQYPCWPSIQ